MVEESVADGGSGGVKATAAGRYRKHRLSPLKHAESKKSLPNSPSPPTVTNPTRAPPEIDHHQISSPSHFNPRNPGTSDRFFAGSTTTFTGDWFIFTRRLCLTHFQAAHLRFSTAEETLSLARLVLIIGGLKEALDESSGCAVLVRYSSKLGRND
ncbi:hypothetical protein QJS10_CPB14g01093 [Acorus calamus]|uniref:Uncharacterized protein n=1 Tax=Acorus calamus TaxID=4465 RepID=A0AAV9DCJ2_ACOCL|nr:hypothetical protein QJS10_CPB14g01093 [Acorus calamus]